MSPRALRSPDTWTDPRHRLGLQGETEAIGYLTTLGWQIQAHRFRLGRHDLDLVARRGRVVAFIEVKTRRSMSFGPGRLTVNWKKRRTLERLAAVWRLRYGRSGELYRFDVIEVIPEPGEPSRIEHLEDAWRW